MKDTKLRAAVIGLGPHGRRVAKALTELPGIELAAVVDRRPEALEDPAFAQLDGAAKAALLSSADELWHRGDLDLVCVTTNGPSHRELTLQALDAGVGRIMVEKPMGCSASECDAMITAAAHRGARLAVNQSRRHAPLYQWLRKQIRGGSWGEPRSLWIQRPGIGLGCLATHSFDLATFLTDREVRSVTAWVDAPLGQNPRGSDFVDPGGLVVMDLGPGLRAIVAQIEDGAGPMSVEIALTGARIRLDEKFDEVEIIERDLSVKPGPGRPPVFRRVSPPAGLSARGDLHQMLLGLLAELAGDGPLECDAVHGQRAVEVLVAAHLSQTRGNVPVALPLTAPEDHNLWLPVT